MFFENKVAIVTGAGRGIGRGIAIKLAEAGVRVVVVDISLEQARETVEQINKIGNGESIPIQTDISKSSEVKAMVENVVSSFNRIDILVNNAGVRYIVSLQEMTEEQWKRTIDINLTGTFFCCKYVSEKMVKQKSGKIINISSITGTSGFSNRSAYCASKGGIDALTRALATELAPYNIYVNSIAPSFITSPMIESYAKEPKMINFINNNVLLKRWGEPIEIANAVLFLASDESDYITGITLPVDGGFLAGRIINN